MKPKNVSKSTKRKQTIHKHNRRDIFLCRFRQRYFILVACYMNIMFVLLWLVANLILIRRYYQYWNFWNDTFIKTKIHFVAESVGNSKEKYLKYSVYILDITNTSSNSVICRVTILNLNTDKSQIHIISFLEINVKRKTEVSIFLVKHWMCMLMHLGQYHYFKKNHTL